ncbi:MAG: FAD-binding protein, partial [Eubacteriales bacterium]|nr:FAD-binding protein [Eubacteriales bacterium]
GVEVDVAKLRSELSRYASGKIDQRVLNVWLNESAAMHDYVEPIMKAAGATCAFTADGEKEDPHSTQYYYPPEEHFWGFVNRTELFKKRIEEKGYYIDFNHSLVCLTKDGGRVTGAIAQNTITGDYVRIEAAWGTLMATGGYEGNPEMIEELCPIVPKCVTASSYYASNKGMGIKAALWAGAGMDLEPAPMIFDRGIVAPGVDAGYVTDKNGVKAFPGTVSQYNPGTQPFLKVDRDGVRFCNESQPYNDVTHAAARRKGGVFCQVFDSKIEEDVQRFYTIGCSAMTRAQGDMLFEGTVQPQIDAGLIKQADTLEELADLLGFAGKAKENFLATCARYNELYDMQNDPDFGKPAYRLSELRNPPYYGLWLGGSLLCTMDSLWINEDMQVLTPECEVIEGLYATGNCAGTTFADNYPEYAVGMCLGRNLTFAKHVVEKLIADGIPTGKGPSMSAPAAANAPTTAAGCKDGVYSAKAAGYAGPIPVTVEIKGEKILDRAVEVIDSE